MTALDQLRSRADQHLRGGRLNQAIIAYSSILETAPSDFAAGYQLGRIMMQLGRFEEACKLLQNALASNPAQAEAWMHLGMALQSLGRAEEAMASYERAQALKADYAEAIFRLAVMQKSAGRARRALESFNRVIKLEGSVPLAFLHRGDLLRQGGNLSAALADYESALNLKPDLVDAWMNRGALLLQSGDPAQALASYDKALASAKNRGDIWFHRGVALEALGREFEALQAQEQATRLAPDLPTAWIDRGRLLRKAGKLQEALASFERALTLAPENLQGLNNKGAVLTDLGRFEDALAVYDHVLAMMPERGEAWYNRAVTLQSLGRYGEALASYDRSLTYNAASPFAWNNRGGLLRVAGQLDEALACFERALALDAKLAGVLANAGMTLQDLKRYAEAALKFHELEMLAPGHRYLLGGLMVSAHALCDWTALDALTPRLEEIVSGKAIMPPFTLLGLSSDTALHRAAAVSYLRDQLGAAPAPPRPSPHAHPKIRLAYVSSDFRDHATMRLMIDLLERHDRSRFEVIGISHGAVEQNGMQDRIAGAFDQFHDVRSLSDGEIAERMKTLEVDIAIDLKGHTAGARPGIFALRPAPLQVSYLGYPGTTGSEVMDYVIADPIVLPFDQQPFYSEQIVHLPHSYQVNDPGRVVGPAPSRAAMGLPDRGFVFCCFNNHWKITAPVFDVWMRLLEGVPGSVLWLLDDSANTGLRREAEKRGIDPARLIFAPNMEQAAHLGRLGLADLALDTMPYNSHTTASDLLWAGVPLITVEGETFAGRVAASLLTAIGLPELIARDLQSYEGLALSLAREPEKYQALRHKLAQNRLSTPLFDAERFRAAIEAAFITMHDGARRSESPRPFAVPA